MDIKGERGPILVTGASSGIGRTITEFLSAKGNTVFAGARKEIDLKALNQLPNVTALKLDVTIDRDVKEVVNWLHHEGKSIYGLVNNAGVSIVGPLIDQTVEDLDRSINVHLYGVHRMTRALAEFMIESKGRIVNISSISGFLTWKFGGPYVISKHALEAYSDTLREELAQFGVNVITVEPGNFSQQHRHQLGQ